MVGFIRKVGSEMRKVSWPTLNELVRKTTIVIGCVFFLVVFCYLVDMGITYLLRFLGR